MVNPRNTKSKAATQKTAAKQVRRSMPRPSDSRNSVTIARSLRTVNTPASVSGSPFAGDGRTRVRHREFLADLNGSVAFTTTSYSINPGLATFPWLSGMANLYESYLFSNFRVEYETACASTTAGSVMLAVDFDAADTAPATKLEMMSFHNAVRSAAWEECCYRADSQDLRKFGVQRYIRRAAVTGSDIKTYDVGNVIVATSGMSGASAVGELYLSYDVELITPQLDLVGRVAAQSAKISPSSSTPSAFFGGTVTITGSLGVSASGSTITFTDVGDHLVYFNLVGTVFTDTSPTIGGTATSAVFGNGQGHNTAATAGQQVIRVSVTAPGQTLTVDFTASATTITGGSCRIGQYQYSLA